jgi:2-C-methyl-D-erythritol 4-phosphate cytidylyltransferase/2-C-methyl-D-erythritol 2,4-cyclodiphosphate synthase
VAALPLPERVAAVVVAAGRGERLGVPEKILLPLAGRPMLAWSLAALERSDAIGAVVVVAGPHTMEAVEQLVRDEGFAKVRAIAVGGARRQDSVAAGLAALPVDTEIVVIHDGARPLAGPDLFARVARAAAETGAAIAAVPVADTLKRVEHDIIRETVERAGLWAAQTPQAFRWATLRRAMAAHPDETVTDEARLCEAAGISVSIVPSSAANLKVTHPEDIAVAEALLRARDEHSALEGATQRRVMPRDEESRRQGSDTLGEPRFFAGAQDDTVQALPLVPVRTGIGYDTHRFAPGRRLVLGGVVIPHEQGLAGHSDADVLLHAIADAILGAAALGDIGQHFPPEDERFRDADSQDLLREATRLTRQAGWAPANVDATLIAEAPRIGPYVPVMRERIAACLDLAPDAVGVKATTNEGMGAIGRGEGIAALASATLVPSAAAEG